MGHESEAWNDLGGRPGDRFSDMPLNTLKALNSVSKFKPGSAADKALQRALDHEAIEISHGLTGTVDRTPEQDEAAREQLIDSTNVAVDSLAQRRGMSDVQAAAIKRKRLEERGL